MYCVRRIVPSLMVLLVFTSNASLKAQELAPPERVFGDDMFQVDLESSVVVSAISTDGVSLAASDCCGGTECVSHCHCWYRNRNRGLGYVSDLWKQFTNEEQLWPSYSAWGYKPGTSRVLGDGQLFVPLWRTSDSLIFADIRGQMDDDGSYEGNWGLGYRTFINDCWIVGAYGFFDRRRTENRNYINQGTFGVEALSVEWDFRANLYVPDTSQQSISGGPSTLEITGNQLFLVTPGGGFETAYLGFDAEVGSLLKAWGSNNDVELRAYIGAFHFDTHIDGLPNISGPRARAELRLYDLDMLGEGSRLTAGVEYHWDQVRQSQTFALLRLRIPLSRSKHRRLDPLQRRMLERIVRDVDVVSNQQQRGEIRELAVDPVNGSTFTVVDATTENVETAIEGAGAGSSLLISGMDMGGHGLITVANNQRLYGGGALVSVVGQVTGTSLSTALPGSAGSLVGGAATLILVDNVTGVLFQDLVFDAGSHVAIFVSGNGNEFSIVDSDVRVANFQSILFVTNATGVFSLTRTNLHVDAGDHVFGSSGTAFTLIDGGGNTTSGLPFSTNTAGAYVGSLKFNGGMDVFP